MNEDIPKNCWEFMKCPKELKNKCEAYKRNLGQECWLVAQDTGTACYGYNKYEGCLNCPWFIKNEGHFMADIDN
jgi:hypothetical protein